jgi:lysophospholipase L1-like esterase
MNDVMKLIRENVRKKRGDDDPIVVEMIAEMDERLQALAETLIDLNRGNGNGDEDVDVVVIGEEDVGYVNGGDGEEFVDAETTAETVDERVPTKPVLFFSDSHFKHHSFFHGAGGGDDGVSDVNVLHDCQFVVHRGSTSQSMLVELQKLAATPNPQKYAAVVICVGSNDISPRNDLPNMSNVRNNIISITKCALTMTNKVILTEPPPTLNPLHQIRQRHVILKEVLQTTANDNCSQQCTVLFVPAQRALFNPHTGNIKTSLYMDATHVKPEGLRRLLNGVLSSLKMSLIQQPPSNRPRMRQSFPRYHQLHPSNFQNTQPPNPAPPFNVWMNQGPPQQRPPPEGPLEHQPQSPVMYPHQEPHQHPPRGLPNQPPNQTQNTQEIADVVMTILKQMGIRPQ